MLTIPLTVVVTPVVVLVLANLSTGEKKIEHKVERLYAATILSSSARWACCPVRLLYRATRFDVPLNGDEIFPSMLEGIASARKTITFETFICWSAQSASGSRSRFGEGACRHFSACAARLGRLAEDEQALSAHAR